MWKILEFDSRCLGFNVAAIHNCVVDDVINILRECKDSNIKLATWKTDADVRGLTKLAWASVYSSASTVTFSKCVIAHHQIIQDDIVISRLTATQAKYFRAQLIDLALISGHCSRFNKDPALTRSQYRSIYTAWMDNIISQSDSNYLLVATRSSDTSILCGFLSFSIDDAIGKIGLLAVATNMLRKGIGSKLMNCAESTLAEYGCKKIRIDTQKENSTACAFYESLGYSIESEMQVQHFWLTNSDMILQNVPYFTGLESVYLSQLLNKKSIESIGEYTKACQSWLCNELGCSSALLTGSATAALEQAAILCGLCKGDEVIMPSYTFVSTANSVCLRGAVPVFVDIDDRCQIEISQIESAITEKTKAVFAVHYAGQSCDIIALKEICDHHGLYLIEDAAQAFLSTYKGKYLGTFGHLGCLSFHYTKNSICGEGGALLINDKAMGSRAHVIWEKGTNRFDFINGRVNKYEWIDLGSSYVPNELSSAFLFAQLHDAHYCCIRRRCIVNTYQRFIKPLVVSRKITRMMENYQDMAGNGHLFWIILGENDIVSFKEFMRTNNVTCYSHYEPLHSSPGGQKYGITGTASMKMTIEAGKYLMRLPVWVEMNQTDIFRVLSKTFEYFDSRSPSLEDVRLFFFEVLRSKGL